MNAATRERTSGLRLVPLIAGGLLALAAAGILVVSLFSAELFPEYSPAHRGMLVARDAGCGGCHGELGGTTVRVPDPALQTRIPDLLHERMAPEEIAEWIRDGISRREAEEHAGRPPRPRILQMPAYGERLSEEEIADVVAYVALLQYAAAARRHGAGDAGEELARHWGCYACHGELGQGGAGNPGSLKGYIPGFFGNDFRALTRNGDRDDLRQWIRHGRSEFIWNQGFAGFYPFRFFDARQVIRMPAYEDRLTDAEVEALVDHLLDLMNRGPLTAEDLMIFRPPKPHESARTSPPAGTR
ncbi:MAG: hypothetical protein Kow00109_27330 [Acidobacteriota bacterium]